MAEETTAQPTTTQTATDLASYQQFALEQQAQNNSWSAEQAQKQMDFQRELSNTAHQREVADLKAAGLNPVLSVNSGASVPNGAQANGDNSAAGNVGGILQQVLSAQSAREVAGMYNAATIAAATIAANASMYGSDMSYWNKEDHPSNVGEVMARLFLGSVGGEDHSPNSGNTGHHDNNGNSSVSSSNSSGTSNSAVSLVGKTNNTTNSILDRLKNLLSEDNMRSAGQRLAAQQHPTNVNRTIWRNQVLPILKRHGFPTDNNTIMKLYYNIWVRNPSLFNKLVQNKGYQKYGRVGKF